MRSVFLALSACGAISHASPSTTCDADSSSLLQARSLVRKQRKHATKTDALLKSMHVVASSFAKGSIATLTPADVNEALATAEAALQTMFPALASQHELAQQEVEHALAAIQSCHHLHGGQESVRLQEAVTRASASKDNCEETLQHAVQAEREACEGQGETPNCLCNEARTAITDQTALCAAVTETYEAVFCENQFSCAFFSQCHALEMETYRLLREDIEAESLIRQREYRTAMQTSCLMDLITAAMLSRTPIDDASLVACDDVSVDDLTLTFSDPPPAPADCPTASNDPNCEDSPPAPAQCAPDVLEKCQGNTPCIDLREAANHHHLMWLNADGSAHVDGEANGIGGGDHRTWTCTRDGNGVGLVGTWNCPGFYGTAITITSDFADDFTPARNNDFINVCALPED